MRLIAPGWCPERPARCMKRATPLGPPICTMASTGLKSTPRSNELVQTTAFKCPSCRASSTQSRRSFAMELWCSARTPARSGATSSNLWYQISDWARVFVKMRVLSWERMTSTTCSASFTPMWPAHGKRSNRLGIRDRTSVRLAQSHRTSRPGRPGPTKTRRASSRFPTVAEMPQHR